MSLTIAAHELIYVADNAGANGRLHHLAFFVDTREEMPARGGPVPRRRRPDRGGAIQARGRPGHVPVRVRARRQPRRGDHRHALHLRPRVRAGGVDARPSARAGRHGASRRSRRSTPTARRISAARPPGRRSHPPAGSRCRPGDTRVTADDRAADPRARRELGGVARRRRLGAVRHRLARRRVHDGHLVPGPGRRTSSVSAGRASSAASASCTSSAADRDRPGRRPGDLADEDDDLAARRRARRRRATWSAPGASTTSSSGARAGGGSCCASRSTRRTGWIRSTRPPRSSSTPSCSSRFPAGYRHLGYVQTGARLRRQARHARPRRPGGRSALPPRRRAGWPAASSRRWRGLDVKRPYAGRFTSSPGDS